MITRQSISVLILLALCIIGVVFLFPFQTPAESQPSADMVVIQSLLARWSEFQKNIHAEPVLGATAWLSPHTVQFLGNDHLLVAFEDGHVAYASLIEHQDGSFTHLQTFTDDFPLSAGAWRKIVGQYGSSETPRTYVLTPAHEWVSTLQNPFVWKFVTPRSELTAQVIAGLIKRALGKECAEDPAPADQYRSCVIAEEADETGRRIVVLYDGLMDDSVQAERFTIATSYEDDGWVVDEVYPEVRCWPGRGHDDFSQELCR